MRSKTSATKRQSNRVEHYHRLAHNVEAERQCCEIRLRAERKWRHLYDEGEKATGARGNASNQHQREVRDENHSAPKTLAEHGVTPEEARRGKKLAAMSDAEFEDALQQPGRLTNSNIIDEQKRPLKLAISPEALWLWGRLRDFERDGYLAARPAASAPPRRDGSPGYTPAPPGGLEGPAPRRDASLGAPPGTPTPLRDGSPRSGLGGSPT